MSAKILCWDIENSPATGEFWGKPYNVNINRITKPSSVMSFAAKWLDSKTVEYWSDFHNGHEAMIARAWELLDEADAVISYNGKKHDTPHINREFMLAGCPPPSPYLEIDLYQVFKAKAAFQSHKLSHIAEQLAIGAKMAHEGYELWVKCMEGDAAAWARFKKYNVQDVLLTEDAYRMALAWIPQAKHPNLQLYGGPPDSCPKCGRGPFVKNGTRATAVSLMQKYKCTACGSALTGGKAEKRVEIRGV